MGHISTPFHLTSYTQHFISFKLIVQEKEGFVDK